MKKEEYVKNKLSEMGYTIKGFADKIGMPNSTLRSMLINIDGAAISNVVKVCQGLGITTDDLLTVEFDNLIGKSDILQKENSISPSAIEDIHILNKYHALDDYGKDTVSIILNREFERCTDKNSPKTKL